MTGWPLASRIAAALVGAYAMAAGCVIFLCAALVPLVGKVDAVWLGTMAGPLVYAVGMIAAFVARSAWRAWSWLVGVAALFAVLHLAIAI